MEAFRLMRLVKEIANINSKLFNQIKRNDDVDAKLDRRSHVIAKEILSAIPASAKEEFEIVLYTVRTEEEMRSLIKRLIPLL